MHQQLSNLLHPDTTPPLLGLLSSPHSQTVQPMKGGQGLINSTLRS